MVHLKYQSSRSKAEWGICGAPADALNLQQDKGENSLAAYKFLRLKACDSDLWKICLRNIHSHKNVAVRDMQPPAVQSTMVILNILFEIENSKTIPVVRFAGSGCVGHLTDSSAAAQVRPQPAALGIVQNDYRQCLVYQGRYVAKVSRLEHLPTWDIQGSRGSQRAIQHSSSGSHIDVCHWQGLWGCAWCFDC